MRHSLKRDNTHLLLLDIPALSLITYKDPDRDRYSQSQYNCGHCNFLHMVLHRDELGSLSLQSVPYHHITETTEFPVLLLLFP